MTEDRAPSAFSGSRSRGGAPDERTQLKSDMQNHLVLKRCITHFISLHGVDSQIVNTIWGSSFGGPPGRERAGP